jgi:hypothetical protein
MRKLFFSVRGPPYRDNVPSASGMLPNKLGRGVAGAPVYEPIAKHDGIFLVLGAGALLT